MQVEDKLIQFWGKYKERGDATEIASLTGLDISTISRILTGEQKRTSTSTILQINSFYTKRRSQRKKASKINEPEVD